MFQKEGREKVVKMDWKHRKIGVGSVSKEFTESPTNGEIEKPQLRWENNGGNVGTIESGVESEDGHNREQ